jgi:predicted transposase YdaD
LDKLLRLDLEDEVEPHWLHVEVQASWASDIPERVFDYWSLAYREHKRLRSIVICLKPGTKQGEPKDHHTVTEGDVEILRFRFWVVRAWEDLDAGSLLASEALGLLPLLPFTKGATPQRVEEALQRLGDVEPESRREELRAALVVFAGNAFPTIDWVARIPEERLMESATFREITRKITAEAERKGREEGERRVLRLLLRERLGGEADALFSRLDLCTQATLDQVTKLLGSTEPNEELIQALEQLLPRAE